MTKKPPNPPPVERRAHPRTSSENVATELLQVMMRDPGAAASMVTRDLNAGADPDVVLGLLDAVEAILAIRGVDRIAHLKVLRKGVERRRW